MKKIFIHEKIKEDQMNKIEYLIIPGQLIRPNRYIKLVIDKKVQKYKP